MSEDEPRRYEPPERKETSREGVEEWFQEPQVAMALTAFALILLLVFLWRTWADSPLLTVVLVALAAGGGWWLWFGRDR